MSYTVQYEEEEKFVYIKYSKKVDVAVLQKGSREAIKLAAKHQCRKILIDAQEMDFSLSTIDIYQLPKTFSDVMVAEGENIWSYTRALVVPQIMKDHHFLETVAKNRGHNVKVFENTKDASEWLIAKSK
jgi:hypothetical protein